MRLHSLLLPLALAVACAPPETTADAAADTQPDSAARAPLTDSAARSRPAPPAAPPAPGDAFAASLLASHVRARPDDGNVLLSPTSLALALRAVGEGASGATRDSLAATLGFGGMPAVAMGEASRSLLGALREQRDVTLNVGTALWASTRTPLARDFVEAARRSYDAEAASLDLASREGMNRINAWASRATNGRIPAVLQEPLPPEVGLFLTNAVYFKGRWADEFEKAATRERPFTRADGSRDTVPLMRRQDTFGYREADGVRIARLPYRGNRFAMYVLLPDSTHGVEDAVRALTPATLRDAAAAPKRELALELPRFTLKYSTPLIPTLTAMGAGIAFDRQRADFSRIFDPRPPGAFISRARQDVFVEVNEEGTEAAAVTSIAVVPTSAPPPPMPFVVDRPFVFAIRDDATGELLFVGRVVDPAGGR